jgi:lipid-A-disaccharide synthase
MSGPHFFMVAGEASGDLLGGRLMQALQQQLPQGCSFRGIGGPEMQAQGLSSLFPMQELSLMGLAEVLPHLPRLIGRLAETEKAVRSARPAALITIDAPAFTLRLAARLAGSGIPRIHYVAPQVWAWRAGRAKHLAGTVDRLLTLLPFEPPYFTRHGLPTDYVGHPVVEGGARFGDGPGFRRRFGIPDGAPVLVVLPGSRQGEVRRLLPIFGAAVSLIIERVPGLKLVVPTVPQVADAVAAGVADWPGEPLLLTGTGERYDAFAAGTAALAASGTVALELALARLPCVIAYKVNPATAWLARRLLTIRYVALPNLILNEPLLPEFLQQDCEPQSLAQALVPLLSQGPERTAMLAGYDRLAQAMRLEDVPPSERAAQAILRHLGLNACDAADN